MLTAEQSSKSMTVLAALRAHIEGISRMREDLVDGEFYDVYLDNAVPPGMSYGSFRTCLSVLASRGFYRVIDGYAWGQVKWSDDDAE